MWGPFQTCIILYVERVLIKTHISIDEGYFNGEYWFQSRIIFTMIFYNDLNGFNSETVLIAGIVHKREIDFEFNRCIASCYVLGAL